MSKKNKPRCGFEFNIGSGDARQHADRLNGGSVSGASEHEPFCMAVLGDFSGRDNRQAYEANTIGKRRLISIDRDKLDDVLDGFDICLQLWLDDESDEPIEVPIKQLDDFHPDRLYHNVGIFSQLRSLRDRLKNNKTFAAAASELQNWTDGDSHPTGTETGQIQTDNKLQNGNLLDSVLGASQGEQAHAPQGSGSAMVDSLVKKIVAPYVEPKADPRQEEMVASVEQAISAHMQFILHHPDFQTMESAWLSLDFLTSRIETGQGLKIFIMDVARHELEVDLAEDNVTKTGLYRRFADPAPGDSPWSLLLGNYRFTDRVEEVMTLLQIGAVARKARAPFISAVKETLIGCESFAITPDQEDWHYKPAPEVETAWSLLRDADEAEYLSLVVPGFLLRAPYGKKSRPIESFDFEEMPEVDCHSCYLWGNGAFIKAEQLARSFNQQGWDMSPTEARQVDRLPLYFYQQDGEMLAKPCAEIQLTEQGGRRILQMGLIPLWSVKNSDCIRSSDFHSIAS